MRTVELNFIEKGNGSPLVLIHGLMMSHKMFEKVLPVFAEKHRVICPDLRGHGGSDGLGPPYTIPQLAKDVVDLLDRLGSNEHGAAYHRYPPSPAIPR